MRDTFVVAKRDFLERVRSKWFVVMTILWPVLMIAMIVVPALIAGRSGHGAKVEVLDKSGKLGAELVKELEKPPTLWHVHLAPVDTTEDQLRKRIQEKDINGFLVVPADVLKDGEPIYYGDNASSQVVEFELEASVPRVVQRVRGREAGFSDAQLAQVMREVRVHTQHTTGSEQAMSGVAGMILGFVISFLLYIAIALYGINVMRSVVTEKSSRVVELLVAAAKPRALMAGKILGVGGAGLAQLLIWLVVGAVVLANRDAILGAFGVSGGGPSMLPSLDAVQIAVVLVFFIAGYIFYASLFAAVGATVSSEQDTQQAQMPITMLLVIAMVSVQVVTTDPRGSTSEIMTMVPFWSPMLMPLRYFLGGASLGELGLSIGILVVSTVLVTRAAAKIYRVGILMYGKRPGLRELIRWLKY
jgi:ABC-2 type transport system permease protein